MTSREVEVAAPGKVNLILRVLDRRPDGYHNLWSVMQAVDLADSVVAEEESGTPGIRLSCEGADLPTGSLNLAYRAAERALARWGQSRGVRLLVRKRLPVAAGLGGGSSDAAATIRALSILFGARWSKEEMADIGQEIGSDVPFFFYEPTALVEGRGDRVSQRQLDGEGWLVLVNPGIPIATKWAYDKLTASRAAVWPSPFRPPLLEPATSATDPPVVKWEDLISLMENDFGPVMEREFPVLRDLRLLLLDRGAQAAVLAGSGSTVFGVFPSEVAAKAAVEGLDRRSGWRAWVTRTRRSASQLTSRD